MNGKFRHGGKIPAVGIEKRSEKFRYVGNFPQGRENVGWCMEPVVLRHPSYRLGLGCALTFASEAKFEIEAKILFRFEAKKKPDFT